MLTADTMNRSMQTQSASCTGPCGHVTFAVRCPAQTAAGMQIRPGLIANQRIRCAAPLSRGPALRQQRQMLNGGLSSIGGSRIRVRSRECAVVRAGRSVDFADRAVASLPYLVPLFDGLKYGRFLFAQFPALANVLSPLTPLIQLYFSFPFASLIVFFAIYSGIVNNFRFSRYVRFNALQSILLDIILIIPGLLEQVIKPPMSGPGLTIYIQIYNTIFFFVFASVLYAVEYAVAEDTRIYQMTGRTQVDEG